MGKLKERFCMYCSRFKVDEGFKQILHASSGSRRGMCPKCQEMRRRPREELNELSKSMREEKEKKI